MNTEYVWWVVVLLHVGGGAIAFLALGRIPEVEDDREPEQELDREDGAALPADGGGPGASAPAAGQGPPVSTTVPGSDEPTSASDTE